MASRKFTLCSQCDYFAPPNDEGRKAECEMDVTPCPQTRDDCKLYDPPGGFKTPCIECKHRSLGDRGCGAGLYQFDPNSSQCDDFRPIKSGDEEEDQVVNLDIVEQLSNTIQGKEGGVMALNKDPYSGIKVDVKYDGTEIILPARPARMTLKTAIKTLKLREQEEETQVDIMEPMEAFPWDGAYCFFEAMSQMFGWTQAVRSEPKHFFDPGSPPRVISIDIGYEKRADIIWGAFKIPGIDGEFTCDTMKKNNRQIFCLTGWTKRKFHPQIKQLAELTRQLIKTKSIYRGKAFKIFTNEKGDIDYDRQPQFMDTSTFNHAELIFSREIEEQINTNIFTPIRYTAQCRKNKIPLNRGILLEGPFGTGKTLTAAAAAQICEEYGWTFITVDRAGSLKAALEFSRLYPPCLVFGEDIDRAASGERTEKMDDILNIIDGVTSKKTEIITVLTTNDVESINRAMIRPGRFDAVISLRAPDAEAVTRLIQIYSRDLLADGENLAAAGEALKGQIPAVIREVIERAKLYAISRIKDTKEDVKLTTADLVHAAHGMNDHLALLNRPENGQPTPEEALGRAFGHVIKTTIASNMPQTEKVAADVVAKLRRS